MLLVVIAIFVTYDFDGSIDFSGTDGSTIHSYRVSDFGALEQSVGFRLEDAVDLSGSKYLVISLIVKYQIFLCLI